MHCNLECCSVCVSTYLEGSMVTPQCMQCHNLWSHQFIRETFTTSFVKKLADVRKTVLLNEQMAYFPHTMEYILLQKNMNELKQKYNEVLKDDTMPFKERGSALNALQREMSEVTRSINRMLNPIRGVNYPNETRNASYGSETTEPVKRYIRTCGNNECKGLVNKDTKTCELCDTQYCSECMEKTCEGHVCKKEDVLTISMLQKDTKNCPKCTTMIHRISGCPDMFCVSCKTAFNWNTLKINERGNSNPHYYQWLRENASNLSNADQGCGGDTTIQQMFASANYRSLDGPQKDTVSRVISTLHHYNNPYNVKKHYKEYNKTKHYNHSFQMITLLARADYMTNNISKDKFTQYLLKMNKAMEYNQNLDEILRSIQAFRQHLIQSVTYSSSFDYVVFLTESDNFVKYINKCVLNLEEVYYSKKCFRFITM